MAMAQPVNHTEKFSGPDPDYGKIPWVRIAILAFCIFITWSAFASGSVRGPINYVFPLFMAFTAIWIFERLTLKPTKVYYVISPTGLAYRTAANAMAPVAWEEMERLEMLPGAPEQLRLHWRGHRGDKAVFGWHDALMTRLTGKTYRGGTPVEESAATPRQIDLIAERISPGGDTFGARFQSRFAQRA